MTTDLRRLPASTVRGRILNSFARRLRARGYRLRTPEPLIPHHDPTLLFTNSAITALKGVMRGEFEMPPRSFVVQPCIRTQILQEKHPDSCPEYMSYFKMCAAFCEPAGHIDLRDTIENFFESDFGVAPSQLCIKYHARHRSLIAPWLDQDHQLEQDAEPIDYYVWKFGVADASARGLTIAVWSPRTKTYQDIGNVLELLRGEQVIAYGFGFGVETLCSRLLDLESPHYASRIAEILRPANAAQARYADLLQTCLIVCNLGVRPGRGGRAAVSKALLSELLDSVLHLGLPLVEVERHARTFAASELGRDQQFVREFIIPTQAYPCTKKMSPGTDDVRPGFFSMRR